MEFGPISAGKFEEVIEHLRQHFPDEPLNECVGLCKTGEPCELLEHHDMSTLEEGFSIMAIDPKTGEIAGVALNGISNRGDNELAIEEMKSIDSIQYKQIFGLLYNTNQELDLFAKYNLEKIFELRILSVNSKYRGKGIAKELFLRSEILAEESGFKLMKVDATSRFSQRVAESLGMSTAKAVKYSEFKDEKGQSIYSIQPPHEYYKVMIKELSPKN
ncbi:PREDICTED: uncharacterized protein LOC108563894 [Nicrophorus vespilloides]|uniref:Uncharacterized protein LOC108563894 n=1 Tax=Nicrophorus vespilloides TaxID=110193 RepID=A0ABM1MUD9_NICVS|nr:PREDICTED: uncharacterized protein LOC108563894 [Nicrophorus vespilloides]